MFMFIRSLTIIAHYQMFKVKIPTLVTNFLENLNIVVMFDILDLFESLKTVVLIWKKMVANNHE